jgi:hypothetical protein
MIIMFGVKPLHHLLHMNISNIKLQYPVALRRSDYAFRFFAVYVSRCIATAG